MEYVFYLDLFTVIVCVENNFIPTQLGSAYFIFIFCYLGYNILTQVGEKGAKKNDKNCTYLKSE